MRITRPTALLVCSIVTATQCLAIDIATRSGAVYRHCKVTRVDPDGITVTHDAGVAKLAFEDLPKSLQQQYHFDVAKASAYRKAVEANVKAAAAAQAAAAQPRERAAAKPQQQPPPAAPPRAETLRERLGTINAQIAENDRRAHTGYKEHRGRSVSYSNVSKDFDALMDANRALEAEKERLEVAIQKLTGEVAQPNEAARVRAAADAYIADLTRRGVVFNSEFRGMICYDPTKSTVEAIYTLEYLSSGGEHLVGPCTFLLERHGDGWVATGSTVGDRRADCFAPVVGRDGVWRRSPMEQTIGDAMSR